MPFAVGVVLALVVAVFASRVGLSRDRAFYPTVLIVIASYNVLFAAMSGSTSVLLIESIVTAVFATAAVVGFKSNQWIVVAFLVGHGLFDAMHGQLIDNTGVPPWWPSFCAAYDVAAGICLAWTLQVRMPAVSNRGNLARLSAL